jgi:hypothetical protein
VVKTLTSCKDFHYSGGITHNPIHPNDFLLFWAFSYGNQLHVGKPHCRGGHQRGGHKRGRPSERRPSAIRAAAIGHKGGGRKGRRSSERRPEGEAVIKEAAGRGSVHQRSGRKGKRSSKRRPEREAIRQSTPAPTRFYQTY